MSNSNIFNGKRFLLLCKQHFIHYNKLLLLATIAYIGVIFIVLTITQLGNEFKPHNPDIFLGFLIGSVGVFGLLYIGHSFPAFRSKESTINYLMMPGSVFEKFTFEFISRIGIILLILPLLYWITFHLQGYFFTIFSTQAFEPIRLQDLANMEIGILGKHNLWSRFFTFSSMAMLGSIFAFTGSAMFSKQPLIKSLFSVAVLFIFYAAYSYIVVVYLGVGKYNPPENLWLIPVNEPGVNKFITTVCILSGVVLLYVAYRKIKEREV